MRNFYVSGVTRPYAWRKKQLQLLRKAILDREEEIYAALYADLRKSPEESYGTEVGLVLAEIRLMLKNLKRWMAPRSAGTNLLNWPSSSRVYRDPLGVVLIVAPWNYPFQLSILPLAGAIAGGNVVVLKPSEMAPATSALIEDLVKGLFPPDVVRVIPGDGAAVVPEAVRGFRFDHIFFTGSVPVGKAIYQLAAEKLVPVTLELGGKSPAVVEKDADLRTAARRIVVGKFTNAGQTCVAPDYLLVHADIKEKLLEEIAGALVSFYGDDAAKSYDYGRIIHARRFDALVNMLDEGTVRIGGSHDRKDLYIAPTIMEIEDPAKRVMEEEIFGPILPVLTYRETEEAMEIIARRPDPLAFYLFSGDRGSQRTWMEKLAFGGGCINNADWHFTNPHLPFGGIGHSGIGAYHGKYTFETFTHAKGVMKTATWVDPGIKYPPFKGKMKWFKFFIR
jgi:aldehyde dehydrogenase (NAD+)